MKLALIISLALNLLFIFLIWEREVERGITVKDFELQVRHHKSLADSAQRYTIGLKDSLEIAFTTIRFIQVEKEKERELRIKAEKKYQDIRVVRFKTDEQRDSVLKVLYPSIK